MAERPPINPFANLQADPTLAKMAASSGDNLANMRRGLAMTQLQNTGAMDRTNATNLNNMKMEGVRQMLSGLAQTGKIDPETAAKMTGMFGAKQALTSGQAADAYRSSGIGLKFPKRVFKPGAFSAQPLTGGFDLKGQAQAKEANKITNTKKRKGLSVAGKKVGIDQDEEVRTIEGRNTPAAKSAGKIQGQRELESLVAEATKNNPYFKGKSITGVKRHGPKNRLAAYIDGKLMYLEP
jgi:hypothetical protein